MDNTYEKIELLTQANIINKNIRDLSTYGLEVKDEMRCLPRMYWIPKLHEHPIESRFIIASSETSVKRFDVYF